DGVDSILWFDSDPNELNLPTDERMRAIRSWVRSGGELVICQPAQRDRMRPFGDLLPVTVQEIVDVDHLDPLRSIARNRIEQPLGPFKLARAPAKPGTRVDEWIHWTDGQPASPYLVRSPQGLGMVTWVAQDLADRSIIRGMKLGWPHVWDRVLAWNNDTNVIEDRRA